MLTKEKGINEDLINEISNIKNEPEWMREFRIKAMHKFLETPNPNFGPELKIDFDDITYFKRIDDKVHDNWNEVPELARDTFDKIGLMDAEKKYLAGVLKNI